MCYSACVKYFPKAALPSWKTFYFGRCSVSERRVSVVFVGDGREVFRSSVIAMSNDISLEEDV